MVLYKLISVMYLSNSTAMSRMLHKINFWGEYSWFEIRGYFLLGQCPTKIKELSVSYYSIL